MLPDQFQFDHVQKNSIKGAFWNGIKIKIIARKPAANVAL